MIPIRRAAGVEVKGAGVSSSASSSASRTRHLSQIKAAGESAIPASAHATGAAQAQTITPVVVRPKVRIHTVLSRKLMTELL
jgi:hypothetical protein